MSRLFRSVLWMVVFCFHGLGFRTVASEGAGSETSVVVVTGAPGNPEYEAQFAAWRESWRRLAGLAGARWQEPGGAAPGDRAALEAVLKAESSPERRGVLWIVLLGHGTFDGEVPRFNLRGDDLEAAQFASWLTGVQRPVVVVAGFSSSGAFLKPISGPGRVIVTATKSGAELNFARFGGFLADALLAHDADLDKDGQTSLLEGWLAAARRVTEFYEGAGRIVTEHALLEDNGDALGTRVEAYEGLELRQRPTGGREADGVRAHQICLVPSEEEKRMPAPLRARRDALELELSALKAKKAGMPPETYALALESILLKLARVYQEAETGAPGP